MIFSHPFITRQRGFTMIEMLLVIVIIAVSAAIIAPSFFGSASLSLKDEARRMQQALQLASEEAILSGSPLRLVANAKWYAFESLDQDHHWQEMTELPYTRHTVTENISIAGIVFLEDKVSDSHRVDNKLWQLLLSPTGISSPATVQLSSRDGQQTSISLNPGSNGIRLQENSQ